MNDWFRSLTVLATAFAGVVAVTIALALLIVPDPATSSRAGGTAPPDVGATPEVPDVTGTLPAQVGGTLAVSGDLEDTFRVDREDTDSRYGLIGDDARIFFGNDPLAVEQMNFGGLSFFPDPDDCTITPGAFNPAIGVAWADLHCADLADVRGNGVVTVDGTIGLAADMLGMRGDLPQSGGSVGIGGETVEFSEAFLYIVPRMVTLPGSDGRRATAMQLTDQERDMTLSFAWDVQTHRLTLAHVAQGATGHDLPADACSLATRELGRLNPRVTVVDLTLQCGEVDFPGLGLVPISGSLIIEQVEPS